MWKCVPKCSECCVCYHMPKRFVERYLKKALVPIVELQTRGNLVKPVTIDGKCFMLDRQANKCTCYKDRPYVCHIFGKHPNLLCPYVDRTGFPRNQFDAEIIKTHQQIGTQVVHVNHH